MSKRPLKSFDIRLSYESRTSCLNKIRSVIGGLCDKGRISAVEARRCSMALVEAVTNAIVHAHKGDPGKRIGIAIEIDREWINIEVKDRGVGFELKSVPKPGLTQTDGRGIFIIKNVMDRVEYKDNTLRMKYER